MKLSVYETLARTSQFKTEAERAGALKHNDNYALRSVLQGAFDPNIQWVVDAGVPAYRPNSLPDQEHILYREARRLKYFVRGGENNLSQQKINSMFIEFLETIDRNDAQLILSIKEKKLPWDNITPKVVEMAFPKLLGQGNNE